MKNMFSKISSGIGTIVKYAGIVFAIVKILEFAKKEFEALEGETMENEQG